MLGDGLTPQAHANTHDSAPFLCVGGLLHQPSARRPLAPSPHHDPAPLGPVQKRGYFSKAFSTWGVSLENGPYTPSYRPSDLLAIKRRYLAQQEATAAAQSGSACVHLCTCVAVVCRGDTALLCLVGAQDPGQAAACSAVQRCAV